MSAVGRERPVISSYFGLIERPLPAKADVRRPMETVLHINARFRVIAPPLPGIQAGPIRGSGFFLERIHPINVRFTLESGPSGNIDQRGR